MKVIITDPISESGISFLKEADLALFNYTMPQKKI